MNRNFLIILVITIIIMGSVIFAPENFVLPEIMRINIIIFVPLGLYLLFAYGYVPTTQIGKKAKLAFVILVAALPTGLLIYSVLPPLLSETEKEYMAHLDSGYSFFQQDNCKRALEEYKLAENIYKEDAQLYVFKAYCYKKQKEYEKAIENSKEALKYPDNKSIYKKAHNFKLIGLNNEIAANTVIGECSYEQKNYKEAKEAYSYVIDHVSYKYTDAYFWRGVCEYYLGEKQAALNDFDKHKQIINNYISDQQNSDYQAKYPRYTNKDIDLVNRWISATNSL